MSKPHEFVLTNRSGQSITGLDNWTRPKKAYQWKAGRSAMELALSWFHGGSLSCPQELRELLESHPLTSGCDFLEGQPEFVTALPQRGEGRNHDLWFRASCPAGPVTVCVEAKADETFGDLVGEAVEKAKRRNANTGLPARAAALLEVLFARKCNPEDLPWRDFRYQLVTAFAGTAIQSARDGSRTAVLVVQEFCGDHLDAAAQEQNDADLRSFLHSMAPEAGAQRPGAFVGPFVLRSNKHLSTDINLLVGKIRCEVSPVTARGRLL